nr:wax ester/triacylglycerol synthase domain-containing protein [Leucobacter weissii]
MAARVAAVPRLSATVRGSWGRHRFEPGAVDLAEHVRLAEPVDGRAGFERLCARLATTRLRADGPLWELLLVPGLRSEGPVGWVFRIHHTLADGTNVARILDGLFDPVPPGEDPPQRPRRTGSTPAGYWSGLLRALGERMPRTVLLGRLGLGRGIRVFSVDLAAVAERARSRGATVNDLVLAAAGAGARSAFLAAGEDVPEALPVSVPVVLPANASVANQVSAVVVRIPLREAPLDELLPAVAGISREAVARTRAQGLPWFAGTRLGGLVMRWFVARQRMTALLTTNVRGPARTRTLCGAPVEAVWALPVLGGNVRTGVAVVSYAGTLTCCVLWSDRLGDAGAAFAAGMRAALLTAEDRRRS